MSLAPSSPRLPSPPPPAEIQIGPKSPMVGPNAARQAQQIEQPVIDANAKRRIHPGTKCAEMAAGPPLVPLQELDSAFQLQEHLAALHYHHTGSNTTPMTRETARTLATPPPGIDKTLWLYELCRFLISQCNSLIVGFLFDTPPCSAATCPEMRASEWQFLCAVHDTPKSCCAIDYCCHTLDWAANVVTNPKIFPSRFVVDPHDKNTALKNLVNVFRRLHRIFAHAWFQHRGVFWSVEGQMGLYVFFKTVCDVYDLLPAENYKLPPEAEGLDSASSGGGLLDERKHHQQQSASTSMAKPAAQRADGEDENFSMVGRTNTRRHIKSSPSVGSAVTTVPEADEDDTSDVTSKLRGMHISVARATAAASMDDDLELTSIPVIVDHSVTEAPPLRPSSVVPPSSAAASSTASAQGEEMSLEPELTKQQEQKAEEDESSAAASAPEPTAQPEVEPDTAIEEKPEPKDSNEKDAKELTPAAQEEDEPHTSVEEKTEEPAPSLENEEPIVKEEEANEGENTLERNQDSTERLPATTYSAGPDDVEERSESTTKATITETDISEVPVVSTAEKPYPDETVADGEEGISTADKPHPETVADGEGKKEEGDEKDREEGSDDANPIITGKKED
ncbi:Mob1/phocein [Podospora didyma]|uniref:Mob1/phocein n=1 Tax=Podospora didyma TaxID=330526 RepID=A0AAE0U4N7_9PEZI|nr:Mob1/phocein [Podospora didyma]